MTSTERLPLPALMARLDNFSHAALKKMARTLGLALADQRPAYLEAIAAFLGTPAHREVLERRLTQSQWDLLDLLPIRFGPFRLRVLMLASMMEGDADDSLRDTLALLACGCLLPSNQEIRSSKLGIDKSSLSSWGANFVLELMPGVGEWAAAHRGSRPLLPPAGPPAAVAGSGLPEFQRTAFVLLAEAGKKPIHVTKEGQPYKTDARSLAAALAGPRGGKRRPAAEPVPALVYFALALLVSAGLLVERGGELRPSAKASSFFSLALEEQARTFLAAWYESAFKDFLLIRTLEFGFGWGASPDEAPWFTKDESPYLPRWYPVTVARRSIAAAIVEGVAESPDAWYSVDSLAQRVFTEYSEMLFPRLDEYAYYGFSYFSRARTGQRRSYTGVRRKSDTAETAPATPAELAARTLYQDTDWMEVEGAFVRAVLAGSLRWLGLVEVGPDAGNPSDFRLTDLGHHLLLGAPLPEPVEVQAGRRAVVQPDYEVVVLDAMHSLDLLAQLDAFAERRTLDRAATYRLTQTALVQGLDRGWTGKRIVKALESANDGPLPQNVRYSVDEWVRLYESLSLREAACLLEADDAAQLDTWFADPELAKLLGARLGPTAVRVSARNVNRVGERLTQRGETLWSLDYSRKPAGVLEVRDPDLIEIAADQADPYLRYRLEAFSEPVASGELLRTYRITAPSVRRAIERGWSQPDLLQFLTMAAGEPLPEDVSVRLIGWSGAASPAQAEELIAVHLPPGPVGWTMLQGIPAIASLIRAVATPELALVAPADLDRLQAELQARGLAVQMATLSEEQLGQRQLDAALSNPFDLDGMEYQLVEGPADFEIDLDELLDGGDIVGFLDELKHLRKRKR